MDKQTAVDTAEAPGTKFSELDVYQTKYDIHLVPREEVENVTCEDMTDDDIDADHIELTKRMLRFLSDVNGLGLAAPQIGIKKNFFVYWDRNLKPHCIYNPRYFPKERKKKEGWVEKCLSYGDEGYAVERYKYISAVWWEYDPENGELYRINKPLRGIDAQVFQHETDHLNGVTIAMIGTQR